MFVLQMLTFLTFLLHHSNQYLNMKIWKSSLSRYTSWCYISYNILLTLYFLILLSCFIIVLRKDTNLYGMLITLSSIACRLLEAFTLFITPIKNLELMNQMKLTSTLELNTPENVSFDVTYSSEYCNDGHNIQTISIRLFEHLLMHYWIA